MCSIYSIQIFVYTVCINIFTLFTYFFYYGDVILSYNDHNKIEYSYDYIIVGSGTAGSLIAHRMSMESDYTYILLEAGGQSNPIFDIPVLGPLLHGSIFDWQYDTVPQNNACLAMENKKCKLPQGKITGGSAKLNNMVHVRGNLSHYVKWFHGKHNYNYFEKQFKYIEKEILPVEDLPYKSELSHAIIEAAKKLGYENINVNEKFQTGFMYIKVNQKYSKRWSTYHTLFENVHNKITFAEVEKVLVNKNNVAYGIQFWRLGKKYKVFAKKGVILAAGTYNTPKILQLSGIGPVELLRKHNIKVIKALPVGKNLQDHVTTGLDLILINKSLNIGGSDLLNPFNMYQYFIHGKGPLTSPGSEVVGFLPTKSSSGNPNIQFTVLPVGIVADRGSHLRKSLGINDNTWYNYFMKSFHKHTATILPILLHPKSKGEVSIKDNNFKTPPLIDPKFLSVQEDVDILIEGLEIIYKFLKMEPLINLGAYMNTIPFPGCQTNKIFTKPYWECYIRHLTLTSFHPVGTCKMGLSNSTHSVVDTSFKVIGIDNLYVADGSVLPTLPSGNINAAIAMMASIFFDTVLINNNKLNTNCCKKSDYLYECLFNVCIKDVSFISQG